MPLVQNCSLADSHTEHDWANDLFGLRHCPGQYLRFGRPTLPGEGGESKIAEELKDPEQWDWDKAEKKPPVTNTSCPWVRDWECASPTKPCPEKRTVHEAHDWGSRTLRTTIQHCPGIEKKPRPLKRCYRQTTHAAHDWTIGPKNRCPGTEKSSAPCGKFLAHKPHTYAKWRGGRIVAEYPWCDGR